MRCQECGKDVSAIDYHPINSCVDYLKEQLKLSQQREKHWQKVAGKLASIANSLDCVGVDDRNLSGNELDEVRQYRKAIREYFDFDE